MKDEEGSGLGVEADPRAEGSLQGGPPAQRQRWPGSVGAMHPRPDHGEDSYRGAGRLTDRKALITGGDSGIGRAVAIAFAREGADVCIGYYDEHGDAEDTVGQIRDAGRRAAAIAGDLTDSTHGLELVERTVEEIGGLDLLVNNAAVHFETGEFRDISDEQLERVFQTNILSVFRVTRAALGHMPDGSAIINTGSVVGFDGHGTLIDYACTKGAIHVFTKSLAQAVASRGIRVNCVAPGPVWTPLVPATREEESVEGFGADTFWNRPAQPVEVAPTFVFLASSDARFITGEVITVSGGRQTSR